MPLDGISSKFLAKELNYELADAKLDRIYQPNRFTILLIFRAGRTMKQLFISANPSSPRIYLINQKIKNPKTPPSFCMLLRKYLLGARLLEISQPEFERVFIFKFSTINDLGDPEEKYLVAEIMGRYSNIIFLNKDKKIHDALIHVDQAISSKREIMPARSYRLPPAQDKQAYDYFLQEKPEILSFLNSPEEKGTADRVILRNVLGFSPFLSQSIVAAAGIDARTHVDQLREEEKKKLSQEFYRQTEMIKVGADQPTLYFHSETDTKPFDFHAFEFKILPYREKASTLSLAMEVFYKIQDQEQAFAQKKQSIDRLLTQAINHVQKKMDLHQRDFTEGEKADSYQRIGELLNSQLYLVKDGAEEATVIDYYHPDQKEIKIKLKAHLTPADNASLYFKRYRKAQSKYKNAVKFLAQDQAELKWLFSLKTALDKAELMEDLEALEYEFRVIEEQENKKKKTDNQVQADKQQIQNALNPGKPAKGKKRYQQAKKKKKKAKKAKREEALPPREFEIAEGIKAFAGRNNFQNDQLSLRSANPDDLWFHAKDLSGTHVILKAEDANAVEAEHVEQAAQIAAWYSEGNRVKSGHGGQVAVDCCLAKYVRKPKGAKPGMVIYDHHKTYFVKPALPKRKKKE